MYKLSENEIENLTILLSGDPSECEEGNIFPCEDELMDILTCSDSSQKKTDDTVHLSQIKLLL